MSQNLLRCFLFFFAILSSISTFADNREEQLIEHVKRCIALAEKTKSKLTGDVMEVPGMTGKKIKHFLNNLCELPNTSYLEIGCWKGSTLTAALYKNESSVNHAVAIDNWSEFGGPKDDFLRNIQKFIAPGLVHFFEQDCFSIDRKASFPFPVNIYLYDGNHSTLAQERAFTYFNDIFEDVFIAIVDDWNCDNIREGTLSAFKKLNYTILFNETFCNDRNGGNADADNWWNGFYVAVIKKNP